MLELNVVRLLQIQQIIRQNVLTQTDVFDVSHGNTGVSNISHLTLKWEQIFRHFCNNRTNNSTAEVFWIGDKHLSSMCKGSPWGNSSNLILCWKTNLEIDSTFCMGPQNRIIHRFYRNFCRRDVNSPTKGGESWIETSWVRQYWLR